MTGMWEEGVAFERVLLQSCLIGQEIPPTLLIQAEQMIEAVPDQRGDSCDHCRLLHSRQLSFTRCACQTSEHSLVFSRYRRAKEVGLSGRGLPNGLRAHRYEEGWRHRMGNSLQGRSGLV
jgi:hypothetical protein